MPQYRAKTRKFVDAVARLPLSRRFSLDDPEAAGEYDAIVVGSDEVWNFRHPWYGSKPIFFGDGLKADRLVSYAASFGNHSAWDGIDPGWASKLQQFSAISVRDENSRVLVKDGRPSVSRQSFSILAFNFRSLQQPSPSVQATTPSSTAMDFPDGSRHMSAGGANGRASPC